MKYLKDFFLSDKPLWTLAAIIIGMIIGGLIVALFLMGAVDTYVPF